MSVCPNGHQVPGGNRFCNQCGATMVLPTVQPVPPGEPTVGFAASAGNPLAPTKNSNMVVYVIAAAVMVLAIVGASATLLMGSGSGKKASSSVTPTVAPPTSPGQTPTMSTVVRVDGLCGDPSKPKPTSITLACSDGPQEITAITWDSWATSSATGEGTYNLQSAGHGVSLKVPATIVLALPTSVSDGTIFTQLTVTPSGHPADVWAYSASGWDNQNWSNYGAVAGSRGQLTAEASPCPGTLAGKRPFGHVGDPAASSCSFIRGAFRAYIAHPNRGPYTVHSDATNRDYKNVSCIPREGWVYCLGGRPDAQGVPSARMYFAQQPS